MLKGIIFNPSRNFHSYFLSNWAKIAETVVNEPTIAEQVVNWATSEF